jgi:purine catabolism regulator
VLTIAEVLRMPAVRSAEPVVLAGATRLDRPVRWVHTTELADIGPLLRGGDLVLTTGIAMPDRDDAWSAFASSLVDSEAAGLVVELGRRWTALPQALVAECEALGLPLVALRREVRFAAVAQAVGERVVAEQLTELREAQRVHDTFTELSIAEAGPEQILAAAQQLSGSTVVLESEQHRVLDYRAGPDDVTAFLDDWERRSRGVKVTARTTWDESNGWLVTRVGRPERGWGRLVIGSPLVPTQRLIAVAERAAAALAMHRLHDRNRDSHLRRLHHELIVALLADPTDPETLRRVALAGLPVEGRHYVGVSVRPARGARTGPGNLATQLDDVVAACLRAAERIKATPLIAAFETDVRILLPVPTRTDPVRLTDRFVAHVAERSPVSAGAGSPVTQVRAADRTLRESLHVMAALPEDDAAPGVHRLENVHIRGLLTLLADDDRIRAFSERELAPLRDPATRESFDLLTTTRVVLEHWENKSAAAARLRISRPVLYDRIARIERALGGSLRDAELRTSVHVALITEGVPLPRREGDRDLV